MWTSRIVFQRYFKEKESKSNCNSNEVIKKSKRNKECEQDLVGKGEQAIAEVLEKYGHLTIKELSEKASISQASARRLVANLSKKGVIEQSGDGKARYFIQKES